ncbi:MAG TPA: MMPL family transporter [Candidatus Saccharimonadales bacterium]|jgi:RND superfamily putative drug exporter
MLARLLKHRVTVLVFFVLAIGAVAAFVPGFLGNLGQATFSVNGSPFDKATQLVTRRFKALPAEQDVVVFHSASLRVQDPEFRAAVAKAQHALQGKPYVSGLISPYGADAPLQVSADKHTALLSVNLTGNADDLQRYAPALRNDLPKPGGDMQQYLTGNSPLNADIATQETKDITHADTIGLPVAFVVLLLAFGTVVAAALPLLFGGLGIVTAFGLLGIVAHFTAFNAFVESAVTMIGLALGIDYSLMIVTRFREELARGGTPLNAVETTMKTAGRAILFSGCTLMIAVSGLLFVRSSMFKSLALGIMLTAAVMVALCLTLLPVVLSLLGHRINSPRILGRSKGADKEQKFWEAWARGVMRHPILAIIGTVAVLVLMALPVRGLQLGLDSGLSTLRDQPSAQGLQLVQRHFTPGVLSPLQVVVYRNMGMFDSNDLETMSAISTQLMHDGRVQAVYSLPQTLDAAAGNHTATALSLVSKNSPSSLGGLLNIAQGSNVTIINIIPRVPSDGSQALQLLSDIQNRIVPQAGNDSDLHVGYLGLTAQIADLNAEIHRAIPIVLAFVLGVSFMLLAFTFRSLLLPLKAIIMNLFSLGATFGLMVLVFQHGAGQQLLGFVARGYVQNYLPLLTFVILFGLSMDYEVFLLTRIREEWLKTGNNTTAVARGLAHTAKVITHAAAIMIVVFASFLIAHILEIKELGFGLSVAVLIDATLIRLLLVPATMRLLGKWNWWLPG